MVDSDSFRGSPPLTNKNPLESNPPKSRLLVCELAVGLVTQGKSVYEIVSLVPSKYPFLNSVCVFLYFAICIIILCAYMSAQGRGRRS